MESLHTLILTYVIEFGKILRLNMIVSRDTCKLRHQRDGGHHLSKNQDMSSYVYQIIEKKLLKIYKTINIHSYDN